MLSGVCVWLGESFKSASCSALIALERVQPAHDHSLSNPIDLTMMLGGLFKNYILKTYFIFN